METTVTISQITAHKLDKLCKSYKCTKKDFLKASLEYFEKHSINPLTHESPAQEMLKLIKRVDQIIAFIRTQEKEILRPALEAIFSTDERVRITLESLVVKHDIKLVLDRLQFAISDLSENKNLIKQSNQSHEQGFRLLARLIDAKGKTNILTDLSKAYSKE